MNPYELITGEVYHAGRRKRWPRVRFALASVGLIAAGYLTMTLFYAALCAPNVEC